jgi:hypothetical protein
MLRFLELLPMEDDRPGWLAFEPYVLPLLLDRQEWSGQTASPLARCAQWQARLFYGKDKRPNMDYDALWAVLGHLVR